MRSPADGSAGTPAEREIIALIRRRLPAAPASLLIGPGDDAAVFRPQRGALQVLTTDAIVGFCGETEEEFQNTLKAFCEIQFDQAFMFAYSPRHSTAAWEWPDDVAPEVKSRRLSELIVYHKELP